MRPSLPHPLADRRHREHRRGGGLAAFAHRRASGRGASAVLKPSTAAPPPHPDAIARAYDDAARRVREAGGPRDEASYACACGYVFAASVSTSVSCPHCGARQAW